MAFLSDKLSYLLKEHGFNEFCFGFYCMRFDNAFLCKNEDKEYIDGRDLYMFPAPTHEQALDFIRTKYNLHIWVTQNPYSQGDRGLFEWHIKPLMVKNQPLPQPKGLSTGCGFETVNKAYDEAIETALKMRNEIGK